MKEMEESVEAAGKKGGGEFDRRIERDENRASAEQSSGARERRAGVIMPEDLKRQVMSFYCPRCLKERKLK